MRVPFHLTVLVTLVAAGCSSPPPAVSSDPPVDEAVVTSEPPVVPDAAARHTARTAARIVSEMPPVTDAGTRREILLHVTMYRAAHETNVGDFTRHFLLEARPAAGDLIIDEIEFRLRVLAALADLGVPVAWAPPPAVGVDPDTFPGSRHIATLLGFKVLERQEGGNRVRGRITDRTAHVATSSQKVTLTWAGSGWNLDRDGVRIVY
jgi:hypothetical protein